MNALASLDGPTKRAYRYRNPLGSLGCACSETDNSPGDNGVVVYRYTTDPNQASNINTLTPQNINTPATQVDQLVANTQTALQTLTPTQKKWGKVLLFFGGTYLGYQLFFSKKNKGVTVNVGKSLNGLAAPEPKKHSRKRKRSKVLETLSI